MSVESGEESGRERPRRGANPRLPTSATLAALPELGGGVTLRNLSTMGACLELESPGQVPGRGDQLKVELAHPQLPSSIQLHGEVMWTEPKGRRTTLGVRFNEESDADRSLRPFLTAEAGSCLFQEQTLVGFVVPHGKSRRTWSVFDAAGKRRVVAAVDAEGFAVHAKSVSKGSLPCWRAATLHEVVCGALEVEDPLRLDPQVPNWRSSKEELEQKREAARQAAAEERARAKALAEARNRAAEEARSRQRKDSERLPALGRLVSGPQGPLGFLCDTTLPESYMVADDAGAQLAYLSRIEDGQVQVSSMGDAFDEELELDPFPSLEDALAAVFQRAGGAVELGEFTEVGRLRRSEGADISGSQITLTGFTEAPPEVPRRPRAPKAKRGALASLFRLVLALAGLAGAGYFGWLLYKMALTYRS
ncbi:MAG TPA: hypothetical protein DEA08_38475 [Planctomycetes bacterium]|nr:hypothetical protein [Planctomycetota bacterium]